MDVFHACHAYVVTVFVVRSFFRAATLIRTKKVHPSALDEFALAITTRWSAERSIRRRLSRGTESDVESTLRPTE
jgi:hypothetical protein